MTLQVTLLLSVVNWVQAPDVGISSLSFFATSVNGIIIEDTVWKVADSPYIVTGNIIVDTNVTLTIESGVTVKFAGYYYLMVKGVLNAVGSQLAPITFTSNASLPSVGDWNGIQSSGFNSVMNLHHTKIEYAGTGIYNNNGNITIANSEISFTDVGIYYFQHSHSNVTRGNIMGNVIESNNIGVQIDIYYGPVGNLKLENNTIIHNDDGLNVEFYNRSPFNVTITRNVISLSNLSGVKIEGGGLGKSSMNMTLNYVTFNGDQGIYLNLWRKESANVFLIEDNDIHNNTTYDFRLGGQYISNIDYTYDAGSNYFGTNDTARIDEKIYDFYDNHKLGKVGYIPILDYPLESHYPDLAIDNVKPMIWVSSPSNGTYTGSSDISITWDGDDAGSGIDYYAVKLDDYQEVNIGIATNYTLTNVTEGSHTIFISALDRTENIGEVSINVSIDLTPPIISDISVVNGSAISSSTLNISWSGSDAISGIDHYEIKIDDDVWLDVGGQTNYTFPYLRDGSHTILIRAIDKAKNSIETTITLIVNTSLLWGPGWVDDAAFFVGLSGVMVVSVYYFFKRGKKIEIPHLKDVPVSVT